MLEIFATSYRYSTSYSSASSAGEGFAAILGIFAGAFILLICLAIAAYVVTSIGMSRVFKKAGLEGWMAWVPFLNQYKFLELGGYNGLWFLVAFVPFLGIGPVALFILNCLSANEISKKLGKESTFVLFPLGFVTAGITTVIWYFVVSAGDNAWNDSLGKASLADGTILGYATEEVEVAEEPVEAEVVETTTDSKKAK